MSAHPNAPLHSQPPGGYLVQPGAVPPAWGPGGVPPAPPNGGVPPIPPAERSTGFWVAVSAAATVGVLAALVIGFFVGQSGRMSDSQIQAKLDGQAEAAQAAQAAALVDQKQDLARGFATRLQRVIDRVSAKAEARGRSQGRNEGYVQGQTDGFSQGQNAGYNKGFDEGTCYTPLTLTYVC